MKEITGVGFSIPSQNDDDYLDLDSFSSLSETDIVIFSPDLGKTSYSSYNNDNFNGKHEEYEGKKLYNKESSVKIIEHIKHWKRELLNFVEKGGTLFVILCQKQNFFIYTGTKDVSGTGRNQKTTNHVSPLCNYDFLPFKDIKYHSATGKNIFTENTNFKNIASQFKDQFSFETYLISEKIVTPAFTTKKKDRILGAHLEVKDGHVVFLPNINFDISENIDSIEDDSDDNWSKEALTKGKVFVHSLVEIQKSLSKATQKSQKPAWVEKKEFNILEAVNTQKIIDQNNKEIEKKQKENERLHQVVSEQESLKDLLFETGKPLENAVIAALKILGFNASNFDNGELELDQIITSPEGDRYIGECEGKDNKDIDVSKFRQLLDGLNADFELETVEEKAFGLLFGNPQRILEPKSRKLDFTKKCKTGAKRENIGLIKTVELFRVSRYIKETDDMKFAELCRIAIREQLGELINFPQTK